MSDGAIVSLRFDIACKWVDGEAVISAVTGAVADLDLGVNVWVHAETVSPSQEIQDRLNASIERSNRARQGAQDE